MQAKNNLGYFIHNALEQGVNSYLQRSYGRELQRKDVLTSLRLEILADFHMLHKERSVYHISQLLNRLHAYDTQHKMRVDVSLDSLEKNIYEVEVLHKRLPMLN